MKRRNTQIGYLRPLILRNQESFIRYQISRAIGDVPESRLAQLEGKEYPYRKLDSIMKVKTADGKLWIHRHETWYGLTKAGKELHTSVNNLDYWYLHM